MKRASFLPHKIVQYTNTPCKALLCDLVPCTLTLKLLIEERLKKNFEQKCQYQKKNLPKLYFHPKISSKEGAA